MRKKRREKRQVQEKRLEWEGRRERSRLPPTPGSIESGPRGQDSSPVVSDLVAASENLPWRADEHRAQA
jgi:hypothetical protein